MRAWRVFSLGTFKTKNHQMKLAKFFTMESIVLSFLLGIVLVFWEGLALAHGHHIVDSNPILETLVVALFLVVLVGQSKFKIPVFGKNEVTAFSLCFVAGIVSMFFDSFAVVLLVAQMKFTASEMAPGKLRFNTFIVKVVASLNALTVGGAFYLGELCGLPYYISSGMATWYTGLPLLIVLVPFSIGTSWLAMRYAPVVVRRARFGQEQVVATLEMVFFLGLLIATHAPILCLGIFLIYVGLLRKTEYVLECFTHELKVGASVALGLVFVAFVIDDAGYASVISDIFSGGGVFLLAAISSPFAGSVIPGAATPAVFYQNISLLMLGAPMFVFSSLVAIMVFRDSIAVEDLPPWAQRILPKKDGHLQEALVYTVIVFPLVIVLGLLLLLANQTGVLVWLHDILASL